MIELVIKKDGEVLDGKSGICAGGFIYTEDGENSKFDTTVFITGEARTIETAQAVAGLIGNILDNYDNKALFSLVLAAELREHINQAENTKEGSND